MLPSDKPAGISSGSKDVFKDAMKPEPLASNRGPNIAGSAASSQEPLTPSKIMTNTFYGKRPSFPPTLHEKPISQTRTTIETRSAGSAALRGDKSKKQPKKVDSFEFELPSPTTPSSSLGKLSLDAKTSADSSIQLEGPDEKSESIASTVSIGSCRKKLKFDQSGVSDLASDADNSDIIRERARKILAKDAKDSKSVAFSKAEDKVFELSDHETLEGSSMFEAPSVNTTLDESSMHASMAEDLEDCMALLDAAEKKVSRRESDIYTSSTSNLTTWSVENPPPRSEPSNAFINKDSMKLDNVISNTKSAPLPGTSGDRGLVGEKSQFTPSFTMPQSFIQPGSQLLEQGKSFATAQAPQGLSSADPFAKYFPPKSTSEVPTDYGDKLKVNHFRPSVSMPGTFSSSLPTNSHANAFVSSTKSTENLTNAYDFSQTQVKRPSSTSKLESMLNQITSLQGSQLSSDRPPSAPGSQFSAPQGINQFTIDRPPSAPIPHSMLSHPMPQYNTQIDSLSQPPLPSFTSLPYVPGFGMGGFNPVASSSLGTKPANSGPSLSALPLRAQHPSEIGYSLSQPDPRTTGSWNHRL